MMRHYSDDMLEVAYRTAKEAIVCYPTHRHRHRSF